VHGTTVLRRLAVTTCLVALAAGLAGCSDSPEPTGGLAIVVGAHSNMPPPSLTGKAVEAREEALVSQAYLSVVVADGEPFQMDGAGALIARAENGVVQKQDRERNRQAIDAMLAEARAKTPETDLLSALDLAARGISSASGDHTIVVLDSGLSTVGPLDFTQPGLLDADPSELATSRKNAGELPDLTGTHVVFQGLGDTVSPQDKPRIPQRKSLIAIWTAIAEAAGAESVVVEESPLSGEPAPELPPVTPVAFADGVSCEANTVSLTGGDVAFQPDSADFKDRAAASAVVGPIAQQMLRDQISATLTGTTANVGNGTGQAELSERRAKAVVNLLVELGVPAERMTAKGLGSHFSGFVEDHDAADNLVPEKAALNRKVDIELAGEAGAVACN
jgi:outer membrane protein OmpA-like peptidoglycan-associated protein